MNDTFENVITEREFLLNEIHLAQNALNNAYDKFSNVVDPDLIDSSIYELNSIQKRYKFLLNKIKELERFL